MGRNLVPTVAAEQDCAVKGTLILTLVRVGTAAQTLGEIRLRPRPRPVLAVLLREPVTKPRRIPTAIAVLAGTSLQAVHPLRFRPGQLLRFALAVPPQVPAISAVQKTVPTTDIRIPRVKDTTVHNTLSQNSHNFAIQISVKFVKKGLSAATVAQNIIMAKIWQTFLVVRGFALSVQLKHKIAQAVK